MLKRSSFSYSAVMGLTARQTAGVRDYVRAEKVAWIFSVNFLQMLVLRAKMILEDNLDLYLDTYYLLLH